MIDIKNSKIVISVGGDMAYFCYYLTKNKINVYDDNLFSIFYLTDENSYLILSNISSIYVDFISKLIPVINTYKTNNKIHLIFSFTVDEEMSIICQYLNENKLNNVVYSIGMIAGESYGDNYLQYIDSKLFKGVISSTNDYNISYEQYSDKNLINYLYTLIYFYVRHGYHMGTIDKTIITDNSRVPKIFYYSKISVNESRLRHIETIKKNIPSKFLYTKEWNDDIKYLHKFTNSGVVHDSGAVHSVTSFYDYTICMFNIVMETSILAEFMTEKTLKAIVSNTPTFLVINDKVYNSLKDIGFWFLNEEFEGNTVEDKLLNFSRYIKHCSDDDFKKLYKLTFQKSMNNRNLLYDYIYSEKSEELSYLLDMPYNFI